MILPLREQPPVAYFLQLLVRSEWATLDHQVGRVLPKVFDLKILLNEAAHAAEKAKNCV
jgi:hypothetical protein